MAGNRYRGDCFEALGGRSDSPRGMAVALILLLQGPPYTAILAVDGGLGPNHIENWGSFVVDDTCIIQFFCQLLLEKYLNIT
jgi:hypothetical protein